MANAQTGQLAKSIGIEIVQRGVQASENIARGDVVSFDTNGYVQKADETDSIVTGFGVAKDAADNTLGADGDITVEVAVGNTWVYATAAGAIKPYGLVKVATGVQLGTVDAHAKPADATTPTSGEVDAARDYFGKTVGRYMGLEGEEAEQTDASSTDVIKLRLGL